MSIQANYERCCQIPSDINEHLPTLKRYAENCEHITEMGVRWIVSTYALLMGNPKKMISYDYSPIAHYHYMYIKEMSKSGGIDWDFFVGDTREIEIEETDLLFIDTLHHYDQLKIELQLHGNKARKYLIFHDTTSFEFEGEIYTNDPTAATREEGKGLWKAIEEFMIENPHWTIKERFVNNNGLTILERN